ncbi:FAD/NAD(P)-binding protein [Xanthomonadaceae bacterium XH05]|nr:FAD/NAD(P)-binding protein [Xanthomonadaceae bacterium XH05]
MVGAGFCGVALARALALHAQPGARIALMGHDGDFARGVAYGTPRLEHCLNVRARDLGIDPAQPAGFADWLGLQSPAREGFQPRAHYGDYLCAMLAEAEATAAARSVALQVIRATVEAVERTAPGFVCRVVGCDSIAATRVVLAMGALPPQPLASLSPALVASPNYIAAPFADGALDQVPRDAEVLVIGTGLTFADVAISLRRNGHRGRIEAISRHGLPPLPHAVEPATPLPVSAGLLDALHEGDVRRVLHALRAASRQADDWRRVIDALRPHTQSFWQRMDGSARRRFLRHLRTYWEIHRHRIAPVLNDELDAMRSSGQLVIRASRLIGADVDDGRARLALRDRGLSDLRTLSVDRVVRAIGLDSDVERTAHPLVARLRDAGVVRSDALGLGMDIDEDFVVLDRNGERVTGLYVLGPLLRGRWWEITAVPELRRAAAELADRLVRQE